MNKVKYLALIICSVATLISIGTIFVAGNYRWQLLPAFILSLVVLVSSLVLLKLKIQLPLLFPTLAGLVLVGLLATAICSYLYPIFTFPVPTGRYGVGTTSIDLVDNSRLELCDPTGKFHRELVVQVWYPTNKTTGVKAPYLQDPRLVPSGILSHLGLIKTNAMLDAPVATGEAPYPVVIYSPAWGGFKTDNTFQTQELASHGFIVIGLEHPCAVPMAIYPDGRVIYSTLIPPDYTSSDRAMAELLRVGEAQVAIRTKDVSFVIYELQQIDRSAKFKGTLNLDKIGIFGHSFGGAVAAQACASDARLKAGMNMDGLLFGSVAQQGATQPFLFMNSDYPRPTSADLNSPDGRKRRSDLTDAWGYEQRDRWFKLHGGFNLTLLKSNHMNFSDAPLRARIANGGGKIPLARSMKIINDYTVAFFDRALKGNPSSLLARKSGSPFPEVVFENHQSKN
jgi:predicted dienelactone hydrolase